MNTLKILSLVGKVAGIALTVATPFGNHPVGLYVFAGASILKDAVNRLGDFLDDGKQNGSFEG
jgi:hypothetical protein